MTAKIPPARLKQLTEAEMTAQQRAIAADMLQSRGKGAIGGPFGVFLHAPDYGDLAQKLGAHCRYRTAVPPRLSEFAILVLARFWRAQYEWYAHAPIAEKAGVAPKTIKDLQAGRAPKSAPKDERAIYEFISELHKTKRVSDKVYSRSARRPRRRRHDRVHRNSRLLHPDRDDAQCVPGAPAGGRGASLPGARVALAEVPTGGMVVPRPEEPHVNCLR